jgi:hypothetical protein
MMYRIAKLFLLLPLVAAAQQAEPLKPDDFAYGMPLEVDGTGALYSFDLPLEVYRHVTRGDMGDLRIFNGDGEVVLHQLRPGVKKESTQPSLLELPFFPILETDGDQSADGQIRIATDKSGAVIDFWQRGAVKQDGTITRYLIDASAVKQPLEKLSLDWGETDEGFLVPVTLEYSNDLSNWRPLIVNAALAALSQGDDRLRQNDIALPQIQAKYYRLDWPLGKKGIRLHSLHATLKPQGGEIERHWLRLLPVSGVTGDGIYEFHVDGHFPVDRVKVQLPQSNTVVRARLYSRSAAPKASWRLHLQGLLYNLQRDGRTFTNDIIRLPLVDNPDWRLEIETDGGGLGKGDPVLELGWVPDRIDFVARGDGPFVLAFGAADVAQPHGDMSTLIGSLRQAQEGEDFIRSAAPGPMYELGGEYRLHSAPPPLPWKRWLLWLSLIGGVLAVALMVRSLYRQMSNEDRGE